MCIVAGANTPFVFHDYGYMYRLVGEACVHGIMDREFEETSPLVEIFDAY
jgi:hypothetical protein